MSKVIKLFISLLKQTSQDKIKNIKQQSGQIIFKLDDTTQTIWNTTLLLKVKQLQLERVK